MANKTNSVNFQSKEWQNALTDKIFLQMIKTRKLIRILCLTVLFGPLFNAFPPHEMVCFVLTTIKKKLKWFPMLCFTDQN